MELEQRFSHTATRVLQSQPVREALEYLASIDLIELCNEVKIECCKARRNSRTCGQIVTRVLSSCGHASLCVDCIQRYDFCPICRIPIPQNRSTLRFRLYFECTYAGLIPKGKWFPKREDEDYGLEGDIWRFFSLFDVALENNLVSFICRYTTDVCMDERVVSSDPVTAFLLNEAVVKIWCKRTFRKLVAELQGLYKLELKDMKSKSSLLLRYSTHLAGLSNVLDVLKSSVRRSLSRQVNELHQLHENILKTKQHLDVMMWCIRHDFLTAMRSRYHDYAHWQSLVRERKSAAVKRSWPDAINHSTETGGLNGFLFIEDAIANLEIVEEEGTNEMRREAMLFSLQRSRGSSFLNAKLEGLSGYYPFENLHTAVDMLFLYGSSDMVVPKQAILLYYLYDRHWTLPDDQWRDVIDDFAASFCITRHLLLESLTSYLLDDHTGEALKEACRLLPMITGSTMRPKIARVLLEREMPDIALMVLRWSGSYLISLPEAVTAVRARVECGLLTEAFTYQRTICNRVFRRKKHKFEAAADPSNASCNDECKTWVEWKQVLVIEICCLCIRKKLLDRMMELPWNGDEEKYLRKYLLDYYATHGPSTFTANLLDHLHESSLDHVSSTVDVSWSEKAIVGDVEDPVRELIWRPDESDDEEEESPPQISIGRTSVTGLRRRRCSPQESMSAGLVV